MKWPSFKCAITAVTHRRVIHRSEIVPPFLKLLRDSEAEVRVAAASKVACISNILEADTVLHCSGNTIPK